MMRVTLSDLLSRFAGCLRLGVITSAYSTKQALSPTATMSAGARSPFTSFVPLLRRSLANLPPARHDVPVPVRPSPPLSVLALRRR